MASVRQPFAPLDGARLQNLTSLKNRQNALASPVNGKRKAELVDTDDSENLDPSIFSKRSKGSPSSTSLFGDFVKPSTPSFFLSSKPSAPSTPAPASVTSVKASLSSSASSTRRTLQPRSQVARLSTASLPKSSPGSAPAGRSPTRGKRSGLLTNRRRTIGPYARPDAPPSFSLGGSAAPFSLDAALKGTISGYGSRPEPLAPRARAPEPEILPTLDQSGPDMKASWFFDIHEDTPEQEMTNLLQHGTCVLDISSDEESERRATRDRAEGRDKENVPPMDDISQTSTRRSIRDDAMIVEKERVALGEMNTPDFYAEGCDESSVIIVPEDEDERPQRNVALPPAEQERMPIVDEFDFAPELPSSETSFPSVEQALKMPVVDVDTLMARETSSHADAAVLQPMEGTGESFELWESGSAKDEGEVAIESPAPVDEAQAEKVAEEVVEEVLAQVSSELL